MAVITAKQATDKKSRVDKAMDSMKEPEKPKGTLRHISVRPAENGYTVDVERDMPPGKDKGDDPDNNGASSPMSYQPPKAHVFNDKQGVLDHISKHMD